MSFDRERAVADAVLLEGYVLYPYRASAPKNRWRWAFGVLAPRAWSRAGGCERASLRSQTLLDVPLGTDAAAHAEIEGTLRFLQVRRRRVERRTGDEPPTGFWEAVEQLETADGLRVAWEEGDVREIPFRHRLDASGKTIPFQLPGVAEYETVRAGDGAVAGRVVEERHALYGEIRVHAQRVDDRFVRLTVEVENVTPWEDPGAAREEAMLGSFVATHLLLAAPAGGALVSLLDPPDAARDAAAGCVNEGTWPVLVGTGGERVLSAPIILYDHPRLAPESPGDFFDATEIDELLTLRTMTLTDAEKREARATDPRARAIVDRVQALPPERMTALHGARRVIDGTGEMEAGVNDGTSAQEPGGTDAGATDARDPFAPGARVRLNPGARRTDAQDLLFAGHVARIEARMTDVDGREYVAVTIEDDPAADLHRWYGRFLHYYLDEVEPLGDVDEPAGDPAERVGP